MLNFAKKGDYDMVVGCVTKKTQSSFGVLNLNKDLVESITEKPKNIFNISSGIYVIKNTKNLNLIPKNKFYNMPDLISEYLSKNLKVGAYKIKKYWIGIENVENLQKVEKKLIKKFK